MKDQLLLQQVKENAQKWLEGNFNEETKKQVKYLLENDEDELIESFYRSLEFGTGGLRGIMGVGTNRMNIYTVGMATQGLSNYLKKNFSEVDQIKVAIAHDCRNNSRLFAETCADIFAGNGFKVYLFEDLRPTPELSYAIRELGCQSGVVITASHNPKEYNGFKAYWDDGGQIIAPHDKNIIEEVNRISDVKKIKFNGPKENIEILGDAFDKKYLAELKKLSLNPEIIEQQKDFKIVYTPIHGTGVKLVPEILTEFGFKHIYTVDEQNITDGNFPTVKSPNPEEASALELALKKAKEVDANMVMATDPDSDRVGIAVKNFNDEFILLNGNQAASLLLYYLISQWSEKGKLTGKEYIVKTIVTTELLTDIADKYNVEHFDVLTGFKFIADIIKQNEGKKKFIGGGEESYGYLAGEFVRDKDAIMSCALLAETAAWAQSQGKTMYEMLIDIYHDYGFYKEKLINVVRKGKAGAEEIQQMMEKFRTNPPKEINNSKVLIIHDYQLSETYDILSNLRYKINLPKSNVLQFILKDGSKISIRPSGTEPKIKFYFSVKEKLDKKEDFEKIDAILEKRIENLVKDLNV